MTRRRRSWCPLAAWVLLAIAPASASAAQTFTVENRAHVNARQLARVEAALVVQSGQLVRYWHTPTVKFGPGGWKIELRRGADYPSGGHSAIPTWMPRGLRSNLRGRRYMSMGRSVWPVTIARCFRIDERFQHNDGRVRADRLVGGAVA